MKDRKSKGSRAAARAIKACLNQLADEAAEADLSELCQLICVAALAAEDAIAEPGKGAPRGAGKTAAPPQTH